MNRRLLAAVVAVLVGVVGAVLLLGYVGAADERAMAASAPVDVLVVAAPIAEGTPGEALGELVAVESVPAAAVVPGATASLDELTGTVAVTDLQPGEQLLAHRFAEPAAIEDAAPAGDVEVPADMHELTIELNLARVLGGHLRPGDLAGVFVSLPPEIDGEVHETHLVVHKALVTNVQGGITPPPPEPATPAEGEEAPADVPPPPPQEFVKVTLALSTPHAEQVVFASEFGRVWLSREQAETPVDGTRIVTRENVFE